VIRALDPDVVDACGVDPAWFCEAAWNLTGSRQFARAVDWFISKPLAALAIIVVALIINRWCRRAVTSLVQGVVGRDVLTTTTLGRMGLPASLLSTEDEQVRSRSRAETLASVLRAVVSTLVGTVAVLMVLGTFDIDLGPLLAGAGIAGIAVGLGAQTLVRDCIAGFFILLEDQFGVGDTVDVGPAIGAVESVTLRATVVRSPDGTQWTVPNGAILRVGNRSRAWVRVAIDVTVAPGADVREAQDVVQRAVERVSAEHADSVVREAIIAPIERITGEGTVVRVSVRCTPDARLGLLTDLRLAVRADLVAADIAIVGLNEV
jgi:moderate conductance mechanosensitive channel